jgi:hypothetical protein
LFGLFQEILFSNKSSNKKNQGSFKTLTPCFRGDIMPFFQQLLDEVEKARAVPGFFFSLLRTPCFAPLALLPLLRSPKGG